MPISPSRVCVGRAIGWTIPCVGCCYLHVFVGLVCHTGSTITDVSNQVENNGGLCAGQVPKQRTSAGGKEDTENSSIGSPLETFEGFDT